MKIEAIIIREIHIQLKSPFETSFGVVQNRRILLAEVIADGVSGWGEVTAGETPASQRGDDRYGMARDIGLYRAVPDWEDSFGCFQVPRIVESDSRTRDGKERNRKCNVGYRSARKARVTFEIIGRHDGRNCMRSSLGNSRKSKIAGAASGGGTAKRISAHQAENQAGQGYRICRGGEKKIPRHTAVGGCKFGIRAGRCNTPEATR